MQTEKELWRRVIAMILTLVLLFSLTPGAISSNAASTEQLSDEDKLSMIAAGILKPAEVFGELDPDTVPEAIDYEDAVSKNHIERLYADEGTDLNTVVFLNIDGTKTRYTFDYPVKYVDADGSIKDISLQIADTEEGYQTTENAVITTFSENISDGIILSDDETNIKLIPVLPVQTTIADALGDEEYSNMYYPVSMATRLDDRTIQYYYDSNTTIEYSLTYTGYKEDIVVSEYTGQTQYEFILLTNGYCVSCIDGSYYLVDENQQIRASVGEIIVFTADERNNTFGDIMVETIVEGEEYRMAIVLDAEYLSDPNTVYPIRIDPTIEINYNNNGAGAIEDVTINSNAVSNGYNNVLYVGSHEIDGISRILMKFPGLDLDALGENVEIQSATVSIRDLMCESDPLEVYCHVYTGASWTEATANGTDNAPGGISTFLSSTTISYEIGATMPSSHRYSFDITKVVQGWYDGIYDQDKGIILKAHAIAESGTDYIRKTIGSYNRGSYVPILTVTYSIGGNQLLPNNTYYLNNLYTGNYLKIDAGTGNNIGVQSGLLEKLGTSIQWKIEKQQRGYVIRSVEHPDCYLAVPSDVSQEDVVVVPNLYSDIPVECFWKITVSSMGGCILQSAYNNRYLRSISNTIKCATSTGSAGGILYRGSTWRIIETSKYTNMSTSEYSELSSGFSISDVRLDVGQTTSIPITITPRNALWASMTDFRFTYTTTKQFSFESSTGVLTGQTRGPAVEITATHKVTGLQTTFSVTVNSNIPNFVNQMGALYDAAYEYKDCNSDEAIETTFNFIGGQKYNSDMWPGVIGEWDVGFRDYVQENYIHLYDYFICESTKLKNKDYIITLIDPSTGGEIDVLHMAATLNRFFYTGDTTYQGIPTFGIVDSIVDDLCGWAGDFQALIRDYFNAEHKETDKDAVYQAFYPMIGSEDYYCPYSDIITDMDSCNLYQLLSDQAITSGDGFKEILLCYYTNQTGNVACKRFTTWIGDMSRTDLCNKISPYCNDHSTILFIKWPILSSFSIYSYQQDAFTDAFVDYLLNQKEMEE